MRHLSDYLTGLPRKGEPFFQAGQPATAGVPFELPYTLALPDGAPERWNILRNHIGASELLLQQIETIDTSPEGLALVASVRAEDRAALEVIDRFDRGGA